MDTLLCKRINGRMYGVELVGAEYVCDLVNGARGYEASVAFYRDGNKVGAGRWDPEGFVDCAFASAEEADHVDDVSYELAEEVRAYLARLPADCGSLVLAL